MENTCTTARYRRIRIPEIYRTLDDYYMGFEYECAYGSTLLTRDKFVEPFESSFVSLQSAMETSNRR